MNFIENNRSAVRNDGTVPDAIDSMFGTLLIEFNDEDVVLKVIKTKSYCDLYRIEKTGEEEAV